ncbi:MAG: hypothetical protein EA424_22080 [Planctomycetaceae bacterium]|nr:MAG: hypothetical protein EA424_22080 [Planctomycetaceae bacterium]
MTLDRPGRPVLECEEFSVVDGPQPPDWEEQVPTRPAVRRLSRVDGLCSDCANYQHCSLRTLEGGIWHCEEYR